MTEIRSYWHPILSIALQRMEDEVMHILPTEDRTYFQA